MADHARPGSFLPTIKCSDCSQEIEIAMMGDHVCSSPATLPPPAPTPSRLDDDWKPLPGRSREFEGSNFLKPGRREPPRIDASAANRPYINPPPLSSTSNSNTADRGMRSPFLERNPSNLREYSTDRSPSPPARLNQDNGYPPFPVSSSAKTLPISYKSQVERKRDNHGMDESNPLYAPASPSFSGGGNVLKRMNTIKPGPFGVKGSGRGDADSWKMGHQRNTTARSSSSSGSNSNRGTLNRKISDANPMLKRSQTERPSGYGGFGDSISASEHRKDPTPVSSDGRSQTFPLLREPQANDRSLDHSTSRKQVSKFPASASGGSLAAGYSVGNPYHTPSESQSSSGSYGSDAKTGSSRSSPPLSESSGMGSRKPSKTHNLDNLLDNIQESMSTSPASKPKPYPSQSSSEQRPWAGNQALESPMDPAIKGGHFIRESPLPSPACPPTSRSPHNRLAPPISKGPCKGCGEQIRGKSVSAADGRLTGKYHKECRFCVQVL
ncbi:MAG: hypothetical protein M1814_002653 [Vezdaea aestivalis]|nr:MAG: hypothetical protein M1814_002653 [Vezdaea aestivalis]